MKNMVTLGLILLPLGAQAAYDDDPEVRRMADAGKPVLVKQAKECPQKYIMATLVDRLGEADGYYGTRCVLHRELPPAVSAEIATMKRDELENYSDYDDRVTELWVFEGRFYTRFSTSGIKKIAKSLNIPSHLHEYTIHSFVADSNSFSDFDYLDIDHTSFSEGPSETLAFLRSEMMGQTVLSLQFEEEISLYQGGGFNVTYHIFLMDGKLVYVKQSWWDA